MAWLLTQSERTFQRAFESGQYSSAIGSLRLIYEMTIKEPEKKKTLDGMVTTNISGLICLGQRLKNIGQNIGNFWKFSLKVITENPSK